MSCLSCLGWIQWCVGCVGYDYKWTLARPEACSSIHGISKIQWVSAYRLAWAGLALVCFTDVWSTRPGVRFTKLGFWFTEADVWFAGADV